MQIKFTENGTIELGCKIDNNELNIFVQDSGIGIEKEQIELIFDQFYKIENYKKKLYRGVGLGLAISKRLAGLLGGEIGVASKPGEGSRFYLKFTHAGLNLVNSEQKSSMDEKADIAIAENHTFNVEQILIAEDEGSNYLFLESILSLLGQNCFGQEMDRKQLR